MRVDFICVGPGRSGTTWLYELLRGHESVNLPKIKETEYFNNNFVRGETWYHSLFKNEPEKERVYGEISNMYYCDLVALKRIHEYNPAIKIIFCYRKPISLLTSFLNFGLRRGIEVPSEEYLATYPFGMLMGSGYTDRLRSGTLTQGDVVPVLEAVKLCVYLKHIYEIFGSENVFIFEYSSLVNYSHSLPKDIFAFLDLGSKNIMEISNIKFNSTLIPRFRLLASFASSVAFILRKLGLYSILNFLHRSVLVKKIILKNPGTINFTFSAELMKQLQQEEKEIEKLIAVHKKWES